MAKDIFIYIFIEWTGVHLDISHFSWEKKIFPVVQKMEVESKFRII